MQTGWRLGSGMRAAGSCRCGSWTCCWRARIQRGWRGLAATRRLDWKGRRFLLGLRDGAAHFAVDVSEDNEDLAEGDERRFVDVRTAGTLLSAEDAGIAAQARAQVDWHARHGFCSVCGQPTEALRGGQQRTCGSCGADHFPRTDPVIIVVVTDGDRCLLGQSHGRLSQMRMFSALAGFMDQGESIEEAVRREVLEEAGIRVGAVRYHSSQPWPFPSSLMIGCHADALTTDLRPDDVEMLSVQWFERARRFGARWRARMPICGYRLRLRSRTI